LLTASTIRRANAIFVIEDGSIAENGTHEQLIQAGGLYSKFYELQFRRDDVNAKPNMRMTV